MSANPFDEFRRAQPAANPFDEFRPVGPTARQTLTTAVTMKPESVAEAERLAKRYPAPPEVIMQDLEAYRLQEVLDLADTDLQKAPMLREIMRRDVKVAAMAQDDIPTLSRVEAFTNALKRGFTRTLQGTDAMNVVDASRLLDVISRIERGELKTDADIAKATPYASIFAGTGRTPEALARLREVANRNLAENAAEYLTRGQRLEGLPASREFQQFQKSATFGEAASRIAGSPVRITSEVVAESLGAFAPAAPVIIAGGLAAGPVGLATAVGLTSTGTEYVNNLPEIFAKLGVDVNDLDAVRAAVRTPEFLEESRKAMVKAGIIGAFDAATAGVAGRALSSRPLRNVAAQVTVQGAGGGAGEAVGSVAIGEEINPAAVLSEIIGEVPGALIDVATLQGRRILREAGQRADAVAASEQLQQAMQVAGQSLLRERSPEQFRTLLGEMTDGTVYVDGQVLNQLTPEVLAALPEAVREQIPTAAEIGSVVEVPVADVLTIAPGTPLEQVFMQNARTAPDAPSLVEAEAAGQKAQEFVQQEFERVVQQAQDQEALRTSREAVKQTILGQLNTAGRFRPGVNDVKADLAADYFAVMGVRNGMTPEQFYQRYPLRVLGAAQGRQTGVLNAGEQKPGQLDGIEAYHWSMAARPTLSSAFYGTGLRGSARDEIMSYPDQRVRQRLSFYVDKGTGVRPEAGVGGVAHRATLNNIYDANADPLKLRGGSAREFETRVLDAGFDGYLDRLEGDQPGQVILLGDRTVQPEVLGPLSRVESGQQVPALARREAPWQTQASGTPEQLQARLERMQSSPAWGDYDLRIEGSELQVRKKGGVFEQSVSTRLPTAKKATENPLEEMLIIGLDAAKMDRQAFEANMAVVRGYPNMRPAGRASADTLAERFIQHVVDNLLWLHDQVPADIRSRSKLWYDGARAIVDRWAPKYGLTDAQVSAVLAVLSPQKDWFMNVSLAERVLDAMTNGRDFRWDQAMTDKVNEVLIKSEEEQKALAAEEGADYEPVDPSRYYEAVKRIQGKTLGEVLEAGDDRDAAIWIRVYDQAFNTRNYRIVSPEGDFLDWKRNNPSKAQKKRGEPGDMGRVAWGSFGEIGKAVSVVRDGSIANISNKLGGQHKVRNFYNNIFNPLSEHGDVTIDTHAVAAALLRPLAGGSDEVKHNFGSGGVSSSSVFGAKGTYGIYAEAYRRAAAERKILPRELQSITWEAVRGLFQAEQKKALQQTVNAVWRGYRKGEVTLDEARAETLRLANGIVNPDWVGTARGAGPAWASSYSEELAGAELSVRSGADGRGAVGDARGTAGDAGGVDGQGRLEQAGDGAGRYSSGSLAPLEGAPNVAGAAGPDPRLVAVAEQYARDNGIPLRRQAAYAKVDPERAARIAAAYEAMPHAPQDPAVREAYDDLARQTMAQYQALVDAGYQFWFMDPAADPYQGNPWNAMRDLRANQSMAVFPTESGFGTGEFDPEGNPLLADTGLEWAYGSPDGETKRVLFNDLFRAVHDAFGHGLEGAGFRAQGEENAWQAHVRLFTGPAVGAITSETRGQNSWLNYGPYGEKNRTAVVEDTVFADQKTGLMPEWTWSEGRVADEQGADLAQGARGTFNPQTLELVLNPNADLTTFFHELGHFFLEVQADIASQPTAPAQIVEDMNQILAWFGVPDLATWNSYTLDQKRPYHERLAENFEQYVMEGKAPSVELQPVFRRIRAWFLSAYKSLKAFVAGKPELALNDDIRRVFDRMLATDEQIAQANEVAGFMPDEQADGEAAERLQKRSIADLKWSVKARDKVIAKLKKQAREVEKAIREQVTAEVNQMPEVLAKEAIAKAEKEFEADPVAADMNIAAIADSFPEAGWTSVDTMYRAIELFGDKREVIDGLVEQRMLEENGDLIDERAIQEAANEAVHNEARARSLATELRTQGEMLGQRTDTGEVNAKGARITLNALVEAAKQFGANVIARTPLKDLKATAWKHTAAERRAGKRWAEATAKGETQEAVQAKQDQVLNNAAAKAAIDAATEAKKILEFFKRVTKGNDEKTVEKGRDPDIVNAARAVLAAYGIETPTTKRADEYLEVVQRQDPETFAALAPMVAAATQNAQPLEALTFEELQGLHKSIQAMWFLAKASREMEVDGDRIDLDVAEDAVYGRLEEIGIPDRVPGEGKAVTAGESRIRKLRELRLNLTRVEQWAEAMDGKAGGTIWRYIFLPIKAAADRVRERRIEVFRELEAATKAVAPFITVGKIEAPEIGYVFGEGAEHNNVGLAELLPALLNVGNQSNKRKLLLGRGWAMENPDGTLDTSRWDAFIKRLHDQGILTKAHWDYAQVWWDALESLKKPAQEAHRQVYGRYFSEITAEPVQTPFGTYRGGYYPAQTDTNLVTDMAIKKLAEAENENMSYAFPSVNKGFTQSRDEAYTRPLKLDMNVAFQHVDKVILFSEMQPAAQGVGRLLKRRKVSQPLERIMPGVYEALLVPWSNDAAKQIVERPVLGDGGFNRGASILRARVGMQLMMGNFINAAQQVSGIPAIAAKLEADGLKRSALRKSLVKWVAHPKRFSENVWAQSTYMKDRAENEVAAMSETMRDILFNPTMLQKGEQFTRKHAYFLQTWMDNRIAPIAWQAGYDAWRAAQPKVDATNMTLEEFEALEARQHRDAVLYADGLVRQTQGSQLPEDVSRFERGIGFVRLFSQFAGYFNMQANTNAASVVKLAEQGGLKKNAGRGFYVLMTGLLAPIWIAEIVGLALRGGADDEDEDGAVWDDWVRSVFGMGTFRGLVAMVPVFGQAATAAANRFNDNPADDRISVSPAVSFFESLGSAGYQIYRGATGEEVNNQRLIRDLGMAAGTATGLPLFLMSRPAGYAAGVADNRIEPTGPVDVARGLVTGTASPESKVR